VCIDSSKPYFQDEQSSESFGGDPNTANGESQVKSDHRRP
jgi:hypothetical protein